MFWCPWTSAEDMHPITGEGKEMATGDREEDLLPEETYLLWDTEVPPDASTVEKKGTMHTTAPKRNLYLAMKETTGKPTLLTYKTKKNRTNVMTTKCMTPKKPIQ